MKRWSLSFTLAAVLAAGCGNYSNEDLDFQLALPEQQELEARMPNQALTADGAPEYYRLTRGVIAVFNGALDIFTGLIDYVRAQPATERSEGRRVWGPFPNEDDRAWLNRIVMVRVADPAEALHYHLEYSVEFRRASGTDADWQPLLTGRFYPAGGVRRGRGQVRLDRGPALAAGYPVKGRHQDPNDHLLVLEIEYQRIDYPITITARVQNEPDAQSSGGVYAYAENRDGSGAMSFSWRNDRDIWATQLEIITRWDATGAGRSDARVVDGLAATWTNVSFVDCWDALAHSSYELRKLGDQIRETGAVTACVFGPP
jgi:hypothetical protein